LGYYKMGQVARRGFEGKRKKNVSRWGGVTPEETSSPRGPKRRKKKNGGMDENKKRSVDLRKLGKP